MGVSKEAQWPQEHGGRQSLTLLLRATQLNLLWHTRVGKEWCLLFWNKVARISFHGWVATGWGSEGFSDLSGPALKISAWVAIIIITLNPARLITQFWHSPCNQINIRILKQHLSLSLDFIPARYIRQATAMTEHVKSICPRLKCEDAFFASTRAATCIRDVWEGDSTSLESFVMEIGFSVPSNGICQL